ncbi:protein THEM6 [Condylostylus longicornis]|uniref:protein THEM6 n=1 Tax=Condylostylus longicornis TaxID=2530218 RepID=UPI00244DC534|nr:protein THEM6 [Condylostylus longicornis]
MVVWCYILASILGVVIGTYLLLEIHYFIRIAISVLLARYVKKRIRIMDTAIFTSFCITNDIDVYLNHMNNARYLRELDFARVDFYERTGLYKVIVSKNGTIVQGATTIRYRRFIRVFSIFKIASRVIYWDEQSIYLEHRFINPKDNFIHCIAVCKQRLINCSANEVMTILLSRENHKTLQSPTALTKSIHSQNSVPTTNGTTNTTSETNGTANGNDVHNKNGSATETIVMQHDISRIENGDMTKFKPEIPADILKWIEYNEISSSNLKKLSNNC